MDTPKTYGIWHTNRQCWHLDPMAMAIVSTNQRQIAASVVTLNRYGEGDPCECREVGEDGLPVEPGTEQPEPYFLCEGKTAADWREIALSNWKLYEMQRDDATRVAGERNKAQQRITELEAELNWLKEQKSGVRP